MSAAASELDRLRDRVARFAGRRIAVLGDLMLDRYLWGRVDRISPEAPVPAVDVEREGCAGLIVSDYGKGVVIPATLEAALPIARRRGFAVSVDPKESHIDSYRGVSLLTPNQHEAGYVQGVRIRDERTLMEVGWG